MSGQNDGSSSTNPLDVAVIGGGISGIYSAWRLKNANNAQTITVFEGAAYIGGRLLSVQPPEIDDMWAELGGMRILPPDLQPLVNGLILELTQAGKPIDLYPFPVNTQPLASNNIVYVRGGQYRWSDITVPNALPYHLAENEQGQALANILSSAIETNFPTIFNAPTQWARRAAAQAASYDGIPLSQWGFWDLITNFISYEAYHLEQDAGGYITTIGNWNAADALPWFLADFGPDATYSGFSGGYRGVVVAMAELFTANGGSIATDSKLQSFTWDEASGTYELNFAGGSPATVYAKTLILALPCRSLQLISGACPDLQTTQMQADITSVTPWPAFKIFTTYQTPWWQTLPALKAFDLSLGRTVTDLPLRQTYYWANGQGQAVADNQPAMLMSSYDDGANPLFWAGFRDFSNLAWRLAGTSEKGARLRARAEGWSDNPPVWADFTGTPRLGLEVTKELATVHGVTPSDIPYVAIAYQDWGADPYGGGWNYWNVGVQSPGVMQRLTSGIGGRPLYVCGESYSDWQGWVEGALETADMVLNRLGVNVPPVVMSQKLADWFIPISFPKQQLTAVSGNPNQSFTFSLVSGSLPPGASLTAEGVIEGTAIQSGTYSFAVVAAQGGNQSAPVSFELTVHYANS